MPLKDPKKRALYDKEWQKKNKAKLRQYRKKYEAKNPEYLLAKSSRRWLRLKTAPGGDFYSKSNREKYFLRAELYENRCFHCKVNKFVTFDHLIPVSKGGSNFPANIVGCCDECNKRKNDKKYFYEWKFTIYD